MIETAQETRVTNWRAMDGFGVTHCRIWQKATPFGMFQRHEWRRDDGSTYKEAWIAGAGRWASGSAVVEEPSLVDVLRQIADGHNDPRTLARETLEALGL